MAVSMASADQALKTFYLGVVANQLNTESDVLFNYIGTSTKNIVGKEVRVMAGYGVNGGIGAGTELGALPTAGGNNYIQFVSDTKNLFASIEISDKAIEASKSNAGAFVNLLSQELDGALSGSKFNLSRMLHGDGSGLLATCGTTTATTTVSLDTGETVKRLMEGQTIDIRVKTTGVAATNGTARRIIAVDRVNNQFVLDADGGNVTLDNTHGVYVQGSRNLEISGLGKIFSSTGTLYGVDRTKNFFMNPVMTTNAGSIDDVKIQAVIDDLEEIYGSKIDFIVCDAATRRAYYSYLEATKRNINTLDLKGGFKSIGYVDKPLVSSRFADSGTMKFLNTKDYTMHHMGDFRWLEDENGKVLKQKAGYAIYVANLVRYAELVCQKPGGQGLLSGITVS